MSFDVDRNIPLPDETRGAAAKYPFSKMEVGDSFLAPAEVFGTHRGRRRTVLEKKATPARPLTPPEVRELLALTELSWESRASTAVTFMQKLGSANPHSDAEELMYVICEIPCIRATLERYAELAEEKGE